MIILYRVISLTIVLGIIVLVHELGHFIAARLMGVRVETFSFGMGKRLFGKKYGNTDFRVSLIPVGGYVKLAGEEDYEVKEHKPDDFFAKNRGQRFFILFMGPVMNFILAFLILTFINIKGVEVETYKSEPPRLGYVTQGSPGEKAGLQPGDLILAVNKKKVGDWQDLELTIGTSPNESLAVEYERDGQTRQTTVKVGVISEENLNPAGIFWNFKTKIEDVQAGKPAALAGIQSGDIILAANGRELSFFDVHKTIAGSEGKPLSIRVQRGREQLDLTVTPQKIGENVVIGISMTPYSPTARTSFGLFAAIGRSGNDMVRMTTLTIKAFEKLLTGKINPKYLSGPIDIAKVSQRAMQSGLSNFFILIAFLSLHIGLINLFPIPVLDGGHLMIYSIEAIIRRDINPKIKTVLMNVGFFLVIALMVFVILNDIVKTLPHGWNSLNPF